MELPINDVFKKRIALSKCFYLFDAKSMWIY